MEINFPSPIELKMKKTRTKPCALSKQRNEAISVGSRHLLLLLALWLVLCLGLC